MCVLTEKSIPHGDFLLKVASCETPTPNPLSYFLFFVLLLPRLVVTRISECRPVAHLTPHTSHLSKCRPVGGFLMIDTGEVDDKIVAVLKDDSVCVCPQSLNNKRNVTLLHSVTIASLVFKPPPPNPSCCRSYGHITTISELPSGVVDRLRHYFLTYAPPFTQFVFVTFNQV